MTRRSLSSIPRGIEISDDYEESGMISISSTRGRQNLFSLGIGDKRRWEIKEGGIEMRKRLDPNNRVTLGVFQSLRERVAF